MSGFDCDIAVVGGGLVGVPLALALAARGWRVALFERRAGPPFVPSDPLDQRCTALSAGSVDWLTRQGLWSRLAADACPIRDVHVSQRGHAGAVRMGASEQGGGALGQVIENRVALAALEPLLEASAVRRFTGVRVGTVTLDGESIVLGCVTDAPNSVAVPDAQVPEQASAQDAARAAARLSLEPPSSGPPTALRARLVIGVDGVESDVRAALGIGARRVDYDQSAVLGTLRLGRDHGHVAYERFTDGGPLALLPRPARTVSFVECVTPERGRDIAGFDGTELLEHLQRRFGYRLGRFLRAGPASVVPLVRVEAERQVAPRAVLLGNAVRLLHPIAGQGYNLALRDVARLVEMLSGDADEVAPGTDPGARERLEAFAAERRGDQRRVVAATDLLARTFRGQSRALAGLRALGLVGLDTVSPLRRRFARAAMGQGF